ncbi:hypothetical protein D5R81_12610 [Parashewanella spongiae]|uniref:Uncharacterized protein n=1 Tax=Parashewanella spongiae TaxID=342950 RepID=A0A3A6TBH9_9GAMM|nr:hypothetical protein [Parashewanella spongiae]MCL1078785.1 hypothetical protein [Parashewanella spongiae]RJY12213.1 hypothetical protein D5R81_12610 [Parashewanella spongiae]
MATSSDFTSTWSAQKIEADYYHSIIHHGLKNTHSSLTLGNTTFSVSEVPSEDAQSIFEPSSSIHEFMSSPTLIQKSCHPQKNYKYQADTQSQTIGLDKQYKRVLNTPAVRENAQLFERYHVNHQPVPPECQGFCRLTTQGALKVSDSLIPTCSELQESYLQSIRLRGVAATHRSFYAYGYHVRFICTSNELSVTLISSEQCSDYVQKGYIIRLKQVVNENECIVASAIAALCHRNFFGAGDRLATDENLPNILAQHQNRAEPTLALINRLFAMFSFINAPLFATFANDSRHPLRQELDRRLTIVFTVEGSQTSQRQTQSLGEFITFISILSNTAPSMALQIVQEIKRQLSSDVFEQLNLHDQEIELERRIRVPKTIPDIKDMVNALPVINYSQVPEDAECCIMRTNFKKEKEQEIIEIRSGQNPYVWHLVSKTAIRNLLKSSAIVCNPVDRTELTCDDFRAVVLQPQHSSSNSSISSVAQK